MDNLTFDKYTFATDELSGKEFSECTFSNCNFSGMRLSGSVLWNAVSKIVICRFVRSWGQDSNRFTFQIANYPVWTLPPAGISSFRYNSAAVSSNMPYSPAKR